MDSLLVCPDCGLTWDPLDVAEVLETGLVVKDANGVLLTTGDTVVIVKDLPVKGAPKSLKSGTKVKNIRLVEGDHNIDCKIEGFGSMALKSEFVRKA
jgi:protein PhnA